MVRSRLAPVLVPLLATGCHLHLGSHQGVEVDGVRLTEHHTETLALDAWPAEGLTLDVQIGDVVVIPAEGPGSLEVKVWEREPGLAHARVVAGRLEAHAAQGPCAVGDVTIRAPGTAGALTIVTGLGDVRVSGVRLEGAAAIETGLGDIDVREAGSPPTLKLSTGLGDIDVRSVSGTRLTAETGMGDVTLREVEGPLGDCSTGMGDIELVRCTLERAAGDTGMGDIEVRESNLTERDLQSGMGTVRVR
jgi:hypothetical protein